MLIRGRTEGRGSHGKITYGLALWVDANGHTWWAKRGVPIEEVESALSGERGKEVDKKGALTRHNCPVLFVYLHPVTWQRCEGDVCIRVE